MNRQVKRVATIGVLVALLALAGRAQALRTGEFLALCGDVLAACAEQPVVQLYLGGALDALALVNETASARKQPLYCLPERQLFDMSRIVAHVVANRRKFEDKNAMTGVIDYLRAYGGCGD